MPNREEVRERRVERDCVFCWMEEGTGGEIVWARSRGSIDVPLDFGVEVEVLGDE